MKRLLLTCSILACIAYPALLCAQQPNDPCPYFTDSAHHAWCLEWHMQDSIRKYWDSIKRNTPPERKDYYLDRPVIFGDTDSAWYKRELQRYLNDSVKFKRRMQRIDSLKSLIYGYPILAHTSRRLQRRYELLLHQCFVKPEELL